MSYANTAFIDKYTLRVAEIVPGVQPEREGYLRELVSDQVEVGAEYRPDEHAFAGVEGELLYELN
ncbi:MAG: hypothetical protein ABUS57_02730 [Pseudomonadota bacterium]